MWVETVWDDGRTGSKEPVWSCIYVKRWFRKAQNYERGKWANGLTKAVDTERKHLNLRK